MDSSAPPPVAASQSHGDDLRVIVRPLPKVAFFYLTWIASLVCGMVASMQTEPSPGVGLAWMGVFFFNLLVISFDFNEERSLVVFFAAVAAAFAAFYFGILGAFTGWLGSLQPLMNSTFYFMVFTGFSLVFLAVWVRTRYDYWEFRPNEVVHRQGVFPKMKRFSTEDMRWDKSVPDLLERLLLGTGTIVLTTPHENHPIVLDHVMRIGKLDDQIANILGVKAVVQRSAKEE